jgi:hypothetical protein
MTSPWIARLGAGAGLAGGAAGALAEAAISDAKQLEARADAIDQQIKAGVWPNEFKSARMNSQLLPWTARQTTGRQMTTTRSVPLRWCLFGPRAPDQAELDKPVSKKPTGDAGEQ